MAKLIDRSDDRKALIAAKRARGEQLSTEEIAVHLDMSPRQVRWVLESAMQKLREEVRERMKSGRWSF